MGLPTDGIVGEEFEYGAVAFFDSSDGLKLALWPRKSLAHDSGLPLNNQSATEFSIGHDVMPLRFLAEAYNKSLQPTASRRLGFLLHACSISVHMYSVCVIR